MRLIRITVFLGLVLVGQSISHATTYYVSPTGSDSSTGTSTAAPWKTIAKVNTASLGSGDQVLFARGGTWREMLQPTASGLYLGAYGTGARPIISASNIVSGTWSAFGTHACSISVGGGDLTNVWVNGVVGAQVSSVLAIVAPGQWAFLGGRLYLGFAAGCSASSLASTSVEITRRPYALLLQNMASITIEHLAFANGMYNTIMLGANLTSTQTFNDVTWQGARYEGFIASSGSPIINNSEGLNSYSGLTAAGGTGFILTNSILSGNTYDAIEIYNTNGPSTILNSTISGNATTNPLTSTISNWSTQALKATNSVLLPNPYIPLSYNFIGLTDDGTNVQQSPMFQTRATNLFVVPFIDDYNNLGVAEQVAAVAKQYGCPISYALNTKLVSAADWLRVSALRTAGNEIVAHSRSHSDLASNTVAKISYKGPAASAVVSISQSAGTLTTYLNGSTTPDLTVPLLDKYNSIQNTCASVNANPAYSCVVQGNQTYFTPLNLADVTRANLIPGHLATAAAGYLTWEVEGSQADIAANIPGYQATSFATPFTSSNATVEAHIQKAGFLANRNGTVDANLNLNGNWLMSNIDLYNIGAEWLPAAFDPAHVDGSVAALVEGLGASGGVFGIYSHGYDEFSLAQWTSLFQSLQKIGGTCTTFSAARAYITSHGTVVPDGTGRSWSMPIQLTPVFANTVNSPVQGAHGLQ